MTRKKYKKKDKLKLINPYVAKQGTPSCKEERGKFAIIKELLLSGKTQNIINYLPGAQ